MNISLIRLKGVIREMAGIRSALERIAECEEIRLGMEGYNVRPPKADTSGPEPTVTMVDQEEDWMRETFEHLKREDERLLREESDPS